MLAQHAAHFNAVRHVLSNNSRAECDGVVLRKESDAFLLRQIYFLLLWIILFATHPLSFLMCFLSKQFLITKQLFLFRNSLEKTQSKQIKIIKYYESKL